MSQSESIKLLNELLLQDASDMKTWLKCIWLKQKEVPEDFNWLGLAEASAFHARSEKSNGSNVPDLSWAEIATSVYDYLADEANSETRESFINSSMLLRAAMIAEFGSIDNHFVLDSNLIIHWFLHSLTMSLDEVTQKAENWKGLNIESIRELRRIKNRLNIIIVIPESDKFKLNDELRAWLSLRDRLP